VTARSFNSVRACGMNAPVGVRRKRREMRQ
jgi:hypothetical protein